VRQAQPDTGTALRPGEQTGCGQGGLGVHPEAEADAERGQTGLEGQVDGMHQDQRAQLGGGVEERAKTRVGQLDLPDPRADLDAEEPQLVHAAAEFGDGGVDVLQRHRAEGEQPVGRRRDELGQEGVLPGGQHDSPRRGLVVAERHRQRRTTCAATPATSMSRSRRRGDQHRSSTSR
jgi:hypothetical protein